VISNIGQVCDTRPVGRKGINPVDLLGIVLWMAWTREPGTVTTGRIDLEALEPLAFTCPRCATAVSEVLYGPCTSCRAELRATVGGAAHAVEAAEYEPKMNVTPNAVAIKDE
jgi:hypothetical protein